MKFHAIHRYVHMSPRKARYVMDLIRSKSVNEATYILKNVDRRAAPYIKKLLDSAIANANHIGGVKVNDLVIVEARADGGPTMKRFRPGPMGRAMRIRKRTSHLIISLVEIQNPSQNPST